MGNVWSNKPDTTSTIQLAPTPSPVVSNPRKRKTISPDDPPPLISTSANSFDPTPDGEVHRYIVRCGAIFWCTRKDISKQLSKLSNFPPYGGLHKIAKWDHFFITFPNATCANAGIKILSENKYRGQQWDVSRTAEHSAKRTRIESNVAASRKRNSSNPYQSGVCTTAADVTAKWFYLPYTQQIDRKQEKWQQALTEVTRQIRKEVKKTSALPWLHTLLSDKNRTPQQTPPCCPVEQVIRAEGNLEKARNHYRNKNEFTVGLSPDGCGIETHNHKSELTVGYALGLVRNGIVFVGEVDDKCVTTSSTALAIAQCLQPVIQQSGLPHYDKAKHVGYWRQITCREGLRTGEIMVSVVVNPYKSETDTELSTEEIAADLRARKAVVQALKKHFGNSRKIGIFWQPSNHISAVSSAIPATHIYGIDSVHEQMCGIKFRIQPTAFFQVNTLMAERMYNLIGEMADVNKNTTVLDVCCGTGTIGLSLAAKAHSVVGIEMSEEAVADAVHNAQINGIENATFIAGKVEHKIHEAIRKVDAGRECVVILDPPRAGLPMNVIGAVRAMPDVKRIVYVACEARNFWRNALGLCRPKSKAFRLEPFVPIKACGADMFPHTPHGELLVLLEREEVS